MTKWESATSSVENIPIEMESHLKIAFGWWLSVYKPITGGWALRSCNFWGSRASFVLKWQHLGRKQNSSPVSSWIANCKAPEGSQCTLLMRGTATRNFLTRSLLQIVSFLLGWMPRHETNKQTNNLSPIMKSWAWKVRTRGNKKVLGDKGTPKGYVLVKFRGLWLCKWDLAWASVCCSLYSTRKQSPTFLDSWEDEGIFYLSSAQCKCGMGRQTSHL